ncbi:hypothetical protein CERSUDRAFT_112054 [Gelatoporia subvermispora B]|uniref:Uncharacterized protein n=1 Tax=Ceriporiopsis subvermispora (strain B) TaxID=914234 RepID=M2PSX0_CERS8|nr:hypothetical protein CERSUDRAFT_112054 [Gelatoporia subvermispora B]
MSDMSYNCNNIRHIPSTQWLPVIPMRKRPRLPPELCDLIIDEARLECSSFDFSSCALTCREWLPRVRFHRWGHVQLEDDDLYKLVDLLRHIPDIAPYVKSLNLEFADEIYVGSLSDKDEPIHEIYQALLGRVEERTRSVKLALGPDSDDDSEWDEDKPEVADLIEDLFEMLLNVEHLHLRGSFIRPRCFLHLPKLRSLCLLDCYVSSWIPLRALLQILPQLQSIFFKGMWRMGSYRRRDPSRPFLYYSAGPLRLQDVTFVASETLLEDFQELFFVNTPHPPTVDLVIGLENSWALCYPKTYASHEHLVFSIFPEDKSRWRLKDADDFIMTKIDSCVPIHSVEIVLDWTRRPIHSISFAVTWLSQVPSGVKSLCIKIRLHDATPLQTTRWLRLVDTITDRRSQFSTLELFTIHILDDGKMLNIANGLHTTIKQQFSSFDRRGILRFERSDIVAKLEGLKLVERGSDSWSSDEEDEDEEDEDDDDGDDE